MIAYLMNGEGWAFRDRKGQARPITSDDVRRVVSGWRSYAGLVIPGRAKDQNAKLDNPAAMLVETGRNVFDMKLIAQVAQVQQERSLSKRSTGAKKEARQYPLSTL